MTHNVTAVFVFDGINIPPEKDEIKAKRRDAKIATKAKIDALYQQLHANLLEQPANIVDELRKELRNYNVISNEDFELFKIVLKGIGVPCLQASGEAEQLCSSLCIDGRVAAVFSADTDNLVHGCPLIINGFSDTYSYDEFGNRVTQLNCVRIDTVLQGLNMTHSIFVDLCIMAGCDYNVNMKGYAAIKSYDLLQKYGSIDNLPRDYDTTCLKYQSCREIFAYKSSETLIVNVGDEGSTGNSLDINKQAITMSRDYLEMAGISGQINKIVTVYQHIVSANDGHVEELNLAPVLRYVPPLPKVKFLTLNIITI